MCCSGSVVIVLLESPALDFFNPGTGFGRDTVPVPVPLGPYTHSHLLTLQIRLGIMASTMHSIMIFFFILWSLYKGSLSAVQFNVISIQSVVTTFGSDVVLTARLAPEMNAEKMEIRWFKPMYRPYVHLYINGKDDYTAQMPQFANRTELLKENIARGIFAMMIRNVTVLDSGEYYCYVESSDHHSMATVQLKINAPCNSMICSHKRSGVRMPRQVSNKQDSQALKKSQKRQGNGTLPVISFIATDTVLCESRDWLPEPNLTWTDNKGNKINPSVEKVLKDEKSLYHVISIIHLTDASNITCTVSNSLNQSKEISMQIRENTLAIPHRNELFSRLIIFFSSLVALMISCWCLYLLLKTREHLSVALPESCNVKKKVEKVNGNPGAGDPAGISQSDGMRFNSLSTTSELPVTNMEEKVPIMNRGVIDT